jgi:hypothetical protein
MLTSKITYDFIRQRTDIDWAELLFGLEHQLVTAKAAIDKATERLASNGPALKEEVELAGHSESEPFLDLVSRIAKRETPPSAERTKAKWLFLVLAWLFDNRRVVADPLAVVEEVYCDFDYPKEMVSFVRYMPMVGPDLGSREKNEGRLYDYWKGYLEEAEKRFARHIQKG